MTTDLIKEAEYIIETYGPDTIATKFARNVILHLQGQSVKMPWHPGSPLPERDVKIQMTYIPDSSGM